MSEQKSYLMICYDIADDKRLYKINKLLSNYATRVLYSVFEGELTYEEEEHLKKEIRNIIDFLDDNVRFYHLCNRCKKRIKTLGKKVAPTRTDIKVKII